MNQCSAFLGPAQSQLLFVLAVSDVLDEWVGLVQLLAKSAGKVDDEAAETAETAPGIAQASRKAQRMVKLIQGPGT